MKNTLIFLLLGSCLLMGSCKKEHLNPFDQVDDREEEEQQPTTLDPTNIAGLHANIFGKTCANSGCHDGTFEPDFRTIESTYNTLVLHPIIKNDPQGTFEYRVVPGKIDQSLLIARLTYDIDGNSGIMPLATEPNSDWPEKKEEYIDNIRTWISAGARDVFGNDRGTASGLPQMLGVAGKAGDWLSREDNGQGSLRVPLSQNSLELYFALSDDDTPSTALVENKIRFSIQRNGFSADEAFDLEVLAASIQRPGWSGSTVNYHHRIVINPQDFAGGAGDKIYFRIYVKDATNPITEIPSDFGAGYIKDYFSFTLIE